VSESLTGSCHCGAVRVTIPAAPDYINDCNCSLCMTRRAIWGYFSPRDVTISGETHHYVRSDLREASLGTHWCAKCGTTTHWAAFDPDYDRMGVNMLLFAPEAWAGIEVRAVDGRSWDG